MQAISPLEQLAQSQKTIRSARSIYERRLGLLTEKQPARQKDVSSTNAQYAHGPQGVFNTVGVDQTVYSTIVRPLGIGALIPFVSSTQMTPLYEIITSQQANIGSEPANECGTPVRSGNLLAASLTAPFGRKLFGTDTIAANTLGQVVNSAEPVDLRVANQRALTSPFIPDPAKNPDFLNSELGMQYYRLGISAERFHERQAFTGNGATMIGSGRDYGYREYNGLDILINTGKIDAITGTLIPAADSLIVNWNNALISGTTTLNGLSVDLVHTMASMENFISAKADRMGLFPLDLRIVMRPEVFFELTNIWPCSYLTNGCNVSINGTTAFVSASEGIDMRDDMRTNRFLWINGKRIPVIVSDGPNMSAAGGGSQSNIYFIPFSANGAYSLYFNYFDYGNGQVDQATAGLLGTQFTASNGGMYLWTFQRDGYCAYLEAKSEMRLVLRVPWLAARITNVVINTPIPTVDGFSGSLYPAPAGGSNIGTFNGALYTYAV